jgi:hypothetical protein
MPLPSLMIVCLNDVNQDVIQYCGVNCICRREVKYFINWCFILKRNLLLLQPDFKPSGFCCKQLFTKILKSKYKLKFNPFRKIIPRTNDYETQDFLNVRKQRKPQS